MENFSKDLLLKRLRELLNAEKIKLWLPPYTTEDKDKGIIPEDLINKYSETLKFSKEEVEEGLESLRQHALSKLEEREKFQKDGLASLRVKLTSAVQTECSSKKTATVECRLDLSGSEFKSLISSQFNVPVGLIKLISKGKVINERNTLAEQGLKNGNDVMAMWMSSSEAQVLQKESELAEVEKTRQAAELLSSRGDDDEDFDVQIADQTGKPLALPREEKQALTLAMTLHEKGRASLKSKRISQALLLLLEADAEFSKCSASILTSVDNYGILCLDIVWCYLLLQNLEQLPNAENRLATCERCFKRSYGENMERLAAIKGGVGTEQALFMRLYLLQGIVAFHQGHMVQAQNFFRRAEFVLNLLHVDETKLNEVMLMGFSEREARLGLRAKSGNIEAAVDHIMQKRKEQEEITKKVKEDRRHRLRAKHLGKTASGEPVSVEYYDNLRQMDFPAGAAAEALRQANNNINLAIEILNTKPELLTLPDPEQRKVEISDEAIQQVTSLGFDPEMVRRALQQFHGDIQRSVNELLSTNGFIPLPPLSNSSSFTASDSSFSDMDSESSTSETNGDETGKKKRKQEEKAKMDALVADINTDANDDHLDLSLSEEREILQKYKCMLISIPSTSASSSS